MDYDTIPCFKCQNMMDGCNEGYLCDKCGDIYNLCNVCHGPMKLLNFHWEWRDQEQYDNFSAISPSENVGKEFRAPMELKMEDFTISMIRRGSIGDVINVNWKP